EQTFADLDSLFERDSKRFPDNAYRMYFTSNHDENSWNGTDPEMYGANFQNFAVLSATVKGMPLIYNGQESGLDKRLEFFEKDEIEWKDYKYSYFYNMLLSLNTNNQALWNGEYGGKTERLTSPEGTYAFKRKKGDHEIWVAINNNSESATIDLPEWSHETYAVYGVMEGTEKVSQVEIPANEWYIISTLNN
ncbi:MAG: alpha-amylase family glycosyl hydrolase, partial [Flavobacteriaceae bacterium]